MLLQFYGENKRYDQKDIAYFFCHSDDRAISHAFTLFSTQIQLCTATTELFQPGTECINGCKRWRTSFSTLISHFQRTKHLTLSREACVRFTACTQSFSTSSYHRNTCFSSSRTECEKAAPRGLDTSFFLLFFYEKPVFLLIFPLFY